MRSRAAIELDMHEQSKLTDSQVTALTRTFRISLLILETMLDVREKDERIIEILARIDRNIDTIRLKG